MGRFLIEIGIRAESEVDPENTIKIGSAVLGCWFLIAIPVWIFVIIAFALQNSP